MQLIKQDLERERRSKQGVENLARALQQTPNFGAEDSQQNVTEKLHHVRIKHQVRVSKTFGHEKRSMTRKLLFCRCGQC